MSSSSSTFPAPNLAQRPPRSPRVRLGGYTILPRVLDKARAAIAGTLGDYKYNNPLDRHFFGFTGIAPEILLEQVRSGAGDWEILEWIAANAPKPRSPWEIAHWSIWTESIAFDDVEMRDWFTEEIRRLNPKREDMRTLFDRLDIDDHVSFGGRA